MQILEMSYTAGFWTDIAASSLIKWLPLCFMQVRFGVQVAAFLSLIVAILIKIRLKPIVLYGYKCYIEWVALSVKEGKD